MSLLALRLRRAKFVTVQFRYPTINGSFSDNADALRRFLQDQSGEVHLVAHSLGGLLVREVLRCYPDAFKGRIVTLGTPHQGSAVATVLARRRFLSWILGNSGLALVHPPAGNACAAGFGVIAGNRPMGVGMLLCKLARPHDGTVSLVESRYSAMTAYAVFPANHMGLLFSKAVSEAVISFIRTGQLK